MGRMVFVKVKIKLNTIDDAVLFCARCGEYDEDIDFLKDSKHVLDAKSLIGVLSVSPGQEMFAEIHSDDEITIKRFKKDMKEWRM